MKSAPNLRGPTNTIKTPAAYQYVCYSKGVSVSSKENWEFILHIHIYIE